MLAKSSYFLTALVTGFIASWWLVLASRTDSVPDANGRGVSALMVVPAIPGDGGVGRMSYTQPPLPRPVGVSRFAAPSLFRQAVDQIAARQSEMDRSSLQSLVDAVSANPVVQAETNASTGASARRPSRPVVALSEARPKDNEPQTGVAEQREAETRIVAPAPRAIKRSDFAHLLGLPLLTASTRLLPFGSAPFPYDGPVPGGDGAFLNASVDGRPAHRTGSGRIYLADETYSDNRSLLHLPRGFNINAPAAIVLFFHGHGATLERDVWRRQKLPQQITFSGMNAVLVAPQFAVNARDSSVGWFASPGALRRYLDEVAGELARLYGDSKAAAAFARLPVIIAGYSGGYLPAAWGVINGGIGDRIMGVVLLDALYSHTSTFRSFIARNRRAFFVSAYGRSTMSGNDQLMASLRSAGIPLENTMPTVLESGTIAVIEATNPHRDYVTNAWTQFPISDVLRRTPGLARIRKADRYASRH